MKNVQYIINTSQEKTTILLIERENGLLSGQTMEKKVKVVIQIDA